MPSFLFAKGNVGGGPLDAPAVRHFIIQCTVGEFVTFSWGPSRAPAPTCGFAMIGKGGHKALPYGNLPKCNILYKRIDTNLYEKYLPEYGNFYLLFISNIL